MNADRVNVCKGMQRLVIGQFGSTYHACEISWHAAHFTMVVSSVSSHGHRDTESHAAHHGVM